MSARTLARTSAALSLTGLLAAGVTLPASATDAPVILEETYTFVTSRNPGDVAGPYPTGIARNYAQYLIDTDPASWLRDNGVCGQQYTFQTANFTANQVTFQTDVIRGTREQIDAIIADGKLSVGEDSGANGGAKTVSWSVETPNYDPCAPIEETYTFIAPRHPDDRAGDFPTGIAHRYPQQLIDNDWEAWLAKNGECGVEYTIQRDRFRGTPAQIDAILADGQLDAGEDGAGNGGAETVYWTVFTPDATPCAPVNPPVDEVTPPVDPEPEPPVVEEPAAEPCRIQFINPAGHVKERSCNAAGADGPKARIAKGVADKLDEATVEAAVEYRAAITGKN